MMFDSVITFSLIVATTGAGLMAGVYFAFSGFIMRALDQLGAARAADAMNAINDVILRSWFMPLFFGTTLLYAILAGVALFHPEMAGRWWLFAAGLVYLIGMFLCTVLFNVPLNNRLAGMSADDNARVEAWEHYCRHWVRWNHLRVVSSLAALVLGVYHLGNL
jgi:uncharacterized membrane protein